MLPLRSLPLSQSGARTGRASFREADTRGECRIPHRHLLGTGRRGPRSTSTSRHLWAGRELAGPVDEVALADRLLKRHEVHCLMRDHASTGTQLLVASEGVYGD